MQYKVTSPILGPLSPPLSPPKKSPECLLTGTTENLFFKINTKNSLDKITTATCSSHMKNLVSLRHKNSEGIRRGEEDTLRVRIAEFM